MTSDGAPSNPVLYELAVLLKDLDAEPNLELSDFSSCRALGATTKKRCERTIGNKKHRRNALLASFNKLTECPNDEQFYEEVEDFLFTIHCGQHYNSLIFPNFQDWKEQRSQQTIISYSENDEKEDDATGQFASEPRQTFSDNDVCSERAAEEVSPSSELDTVTEGLSVMALDADHNGDTTQGNGHCEEKAGPKTNGLELVSLRPQGPTRDPSPVMAEISEYLAPEEQVEGVLYILEHQEVGGVFKIGCTTKEPSFTQQQDDNCYGTVTKVIHKTSGGPFQGALRAEKLSHTILRHQDLVVGQCEKCGKGHMKWFKASREHVCETVRIMEQFVQLPAYTLRDGAMKLSPPVHDAVQALHDFSPESMRLLMTKKEASSVRITSDTKEILDTTTPVTKMTVVTESTYQILDEVTPGSRDALTRPSTAPAAIRPGKGRESLGTTIERLGHKAKHYLGRRLIKSGDGLPAKEEHGLFR